MLSEINKIISKDVVFSQIEKWKSANLPNVQIGYEESTAQAVSLVAALNDRSVGAIGAKLASKIYKIPIIASNVQNSPNITFFATISCDSPDMSKIDNLLFLASELSPERLTVIEGLAIHFDCRIVFEETISVDRISVIGVDADPNFHAPGNKNNFPNLIQAIENQVNGVCFVGGYCGPSFTRVILNHQIKQLNE